VCLQERMNMSIIHCLLPTYFDRKFIFISHDVQAYVAQEGIVEAFTFMYSLHITKL